MKVHLLLLLALAGPLCSFTRASPTVKPTSGDIETPITETATSVHIITGPPPSSPKSLPEVAMVSTAGPVTVPEDPADVSTVTPDLATSTIAVQAHITTAVASTVDATASDEKTSPPPVTTAAAVLKTTSLDEIDGPSTAAGTEVLPGPTQSGDPTDASESSSIGEKVEIEDDMEEGLSTGQIVGIVIGAIVAVVIVTAVVIAMLRKMGKYSP
ncbi:proline-rich receptor-like protein kinase PERK1 isoform X1 [Fundulus heteroclitus]|uniref:proline-rich receptor-like protein kinase PERK1 isoform X1 n=1 Tax=Fundulus heteroclitus TaxID=8078 RepID=UPI00165CBF14|nr:proline-rich receptor-like protein kinase PERK1 isoform X1 [Fundulus heteroclitus]